jgi:hypothetical protein
MRERPVIICKTKKNLEEMRVHRLAVIVVSEPLGGLRIVSLLHEKYPSGAEAQIFFEPSFGTTEVVP